MVTLDWRKVGTRRAYEEICMTTETTPIASIECAQALANANDLKQKQYLSDEEKAEIQRKAHGY